MNKLLMVGLLALFMAGCISKPAPWSPDGKTSDADSQNMDGTEELEISDLDTVEVVPDVDDVVCQPQCNDKDCGDNGCGGSCGDCGEFLTCAGGTCHPDYCNFGLGEFGCCADKVWFWCDKVEGLQWSDCSGNNPPLNTCGWDFDKYKCGGESADPNSLLPLECCMPDCEQKDCGSDDCWNTCGGCNEPQDECIEFKCICVAACDDRECGNGGCPELPDTCGTCEGEQEACDDGHCVCQPACEGIACGDDGCGGECGTCPVEHYICIQGTCVCQGDCTDKTCGDDGCNESCGACAPGMECQDNLCEEGAPPTITLLPFNSPIVIMPFETTFWDPEYEEGMVVKCYLNGILDGETVYSPYEIQELPTGMHTFCCQLHTKDGPLPNCEATDCVTIKGHKVDCENHADCNDSNPCSVDACTSSKDGWVCSYGPSGSQNCCKSYFDCDCKDGVWQICKPDNATCVDCLFDLDCDDTDDISIDSCIAGSCVHCSPDCTDKTCGDDGCDGSCGECGDGNPCNGTETCSNYQCTSGEAVDCSEVSQCLKDECNPQTGKCDLPVDNSTVCDDEVFCTELDLCQDGVCIPGDAKDCDDSDDCTDDSCGPTGCLHESSADHSACDSGAGKCFFGLCYPLIPTCGETVCPEMAGFDIYCNAQEHCEYIRTLATEAWHEWDIWIFVPPGSFAMGSTGEDGNYYEKPIHNVTIGHGYFLSKYEIVVSQYEACMAHAPDQCTAPSVGDWNGGEWGENSSGKGRSTHPQNGLTWQQSQDFCAWIIADGRLPSEAEWEYATTGPVHRVYPWGNTPIPTCENSTAVFNEGGTVDDYGCGDGGTKPVGTMTSGESWSGAMDMSGNLWEWTGDWFHESYSNAPTDGSSWVFPESTKRSIRGGGFDYGWLSLRSAARGSNEPAFESGCFGARCVSPLAGTCVSNCGGHACGDNGCGESCGECSPGSTCLMGDCQPFAKLRWRLAAGQWNSCAVNDDKTVWCWGENRNGEVGDGTTVPRPSPVMVQGLTEVVAVTTQRSHVCALKGDGTVWCWGNNWSGQLGDETGESKLTPVQVQELSDVVAVGAGSSHTCASKADGTAWCWGGNGHGELGDGTNDKKLAPVQVQGLSDSVSVSGGQEFSCGMKVDGTVWCWGSNQNGSLGDGTWSNTKTPVQVLGISDAIDLRAGDWHACALTSTGTVWCWGGLSDGILGDGTTGKSNIPVAVQGVSGAVALSTGEHHTCALTEDGTAWCWGNNDYGELGDGTNEDKLTPVMVQGLSDAVAVSAGFYHTCALKTDGSYWCHGSNSSGQLGIGTMGNSLLPVVVQGLSGAVSVATGGGRTCAISNDGKLWCWGSSGAGALGDGTLVPKQTPALVQLSDAAAVSMNSEHTCAVTGDGAAWCWGWNDKGQLGDGTTESKTVPVVVTGLSQVAAMAVGTSFSCAVKADATAWCWGSNSKGLLGDGTKENKSSPTPVNELTGVTDVSAGSSHTCALKSDQTVWCWGYNSSGQLGDDTTDDKTTPVQVHGLSDVVMVDARSEHTCALKEDKTVWCWGENEYGALGDGTMEDRLTPVQTTGLAGVVSLGGGGLQSGWFGTDTQCAITDDGMAWCWGNNNKGQLGDGTVDNKLVPVAVQGLSEMTSVTGGSSHTCGLKSDGTVWCWGSNHNGQLGSGTAWKTTPIQFPLTP
jgi:alpha-tubulin suppressor-like RCC1 family protein/formylglycine-generating enzyme required for sulfatase activity